MGVFDGMFDVIADTFREDAPTSYTAPSPGAVAIPCRAMLDRRDVNAADDDGRPLAGQLTLEVLAAEVALPAQRGVFRIGARVFTVINRPRLVDGNGLLWTMWVEE